MKKWQIYALFFLVTGLALVLVPLPRAAKDILYKTYNLVLFLYVVCTFAAPLVKDFFVQRKERIEKEIAEAEQLKKKAEALVRSCQEKIAALTEEKEQILEKCRLEGDREREQIIREAEEEARRIIDQAHGIILQEARKVRNSLKDEVVRTSVQMAEDMIREHYSQADQERAIEETLSTMRDVGL